jgi:hypothetical protein
MNWGPLFSISAVFVRRMITWIRCGAKGKYGWMENALKVRSPLAPDEPVKLMPLKSWGARQVRRDKPV